MDVDYGLVIGVCISILLVVVNDQKFQMRSLEIYDNDGSKDIYCDQEFVVNLASRGQNPYVKIFRAQRSIYYVNCENFQEQLYVKIGFSPNERLLKMNNVKEEEFNEDPDVILDLSGVSYVDTTGVKLLQQLVEDFGKIGVCFYICEAHGKMFLGLNIVSKDWDQR